MRKDLFTITSRYYPVETTQLTTADGKTVVYLKRRRMPQPEEFVTLQEHRVIEGDRLDNITAKYLGDPYGPPYPWSYDGPATTTAGQISDSWGRSFAVTVDTNLSDTYKNHGDYVSQQGGDAEAAHSPIGKPITSNK